MHVTDEMADLIYEAIRFADWAAGEGICPVAEECARAPEDFLFDYSAKSGDEDWDTLADRVSAALRAAPAPAAVPVAWRDETDAEHIARDMREGCFPTRSERQQVPVIHPAPQPSGPVEVKPLEWEERVGVDGTFDAYTSIGHYIATITDDDRGMWFAVGLTQSNYCAPDIDIAKAAAQADYERRIRSALAAPPAPVADGEPGYWQDKAEGLEADLDSALDIIFRRGDAGAREWLAMNYPGKFPAAPTEAGR